MATTQMAKSAVEVNMNQFFAAFLLFSDMRPRQYIGKNPFESLENADALSQEELSEHILQAVDVNHLLTGSVLSRYTLYSDNTIIPVQSDAAIFHCEQALLKKFPSSFDQSVPVAFSRHFVGGDPFDHTHYDDEFGEIKHESGRVVGNISSIADLLFSAQHRLFLFMVLIIGRRFRLLRWDRAGIVVSTPVDYVSDPTILCDALQRLSDLDDTALGLDPTAIRLLPGDRDFLRMDSAALENPHDVDHSERDLDTPPTHPITFAYACTLFRTSLASGWPRYKLTVPDKGAWREYLVGKPTFRANGVIGRGTRGYVALDCVTNRFVWLKDVWRPAYAMGVAEGDILQSLNDAGVENVLTLVCHGDVDEDATVTADYWECGHSCATDTPSCSQDSMYSLVDPPPSDNKKRKRSTDDEGGVTSSWSMSQALRSIDGWDGPLRQHKHYRMVVEEVALPLTCFKNGKQLCSIVLDALEAHYQAATNPHTRLLHGDVSVSNILIYPKVRYNDDGDKATMVWTGLLCDWELATLVNSRQSSSPSSSQMGTYQFKSINLLTMPSRPTKVADELESFLYVLLHCSVLYLRSTCSYPTSWIDNFFNQYAGPGIPLACGWKSMAMLVDDWLREGWYPHLIRFHSPMDALLQSLMACFRARYKVTGYDAMLEQQQHPQPDFPPSGEPLYPVDRPDIVFFKFDDDGARKAEKSDCNDEGCSSVEVDDTPTEKDRHLAAQILNHEFMLDEIADAIRTLDWPEEDRMPGLQAPQSAEPTRYMANKKPKLNF
ncbi:hypothetical protein GSI_05190 [Ganoderma sinense ZZ0214-1]|uniref:Fungal-type protein kinase domain-containing protein n=1 Tax=Ganoderma sinense ZZ0214-1 TaxID=1077348 RepID=A0A2G8SFL2_9APHY|nr:hypothetical protein GSI_05190 [Ganoderma sinense ZZ0214-1]